MYSSGSTIPQGGKILDRGLEEESAASEHRGLLAEAVKGANSLTSKQIPFFHPVSGFQVKVSKPLSLLASSVGNTRSLKERWEEISFSGAKTGHE